MSSQKRYRQVAGEIRRRIDAGRYRPGSRLPAERELAAELGCSRTTLREALLALEFADALELRDRSGAFVRPPSTAVVAPAPAPAALPLADQPGPYEVLELRRLIEGEAVFRVALSASVGEIGAIRAAADKLSTISLNDLTRFQYWDRLFHSHIAAACRNSLYADLIEKLWDQRDGPLWETWYLGTRAAAHRRRSVRQHLKIAALIGERNGERARAAMHEHIDSITERFLNY